MKNLCKIRAIQHAIKNFEKRFEQNNGLDLNEGMTLCNLNENDKLTAGEVSELLEVSFSNTSKILKNLEEKRLIKRSLGAADKRQMVFTLTPKGKKIVSETKCGLSNLPEILRQVLDAIPGSLAKI